MEAMKANAFAGATLLSMNMAKISLGSLSIFCKWVGALELLTTNIIG